MAHGAPSVDVKEATKLLKRVAAFEEKAKVDIARAKPWAPKK